MILGTINEGIVLDHIKAGKAMEIYKYLKLDELESTVAIIKNADSVKMGKKDVLKIYENIDLDLEVLGYIDPGITVNIVENGKIVKRSHLELPEKIEGVLQCKNPRCITSVEQELPQVFKLTDRKKEIYRCAYCESKAK